MCDMFEELCWSGHLHSWPLAFFLIILFFRACLMFLDWDYSSPMPWIPTMDSGLQEPLLPLSFNDAVKAGKIAKVPIIMGCCKDEGLILSSTFIRDRERLELLVK